MNLVKIPSVVVAMISRVQGSVMVVRRVVGSQGPAPHHEGMMMIMMLIVLIVGLEVVGGSVDICRTYRTCKRA